MILNGPLPYRPKSCSLSNAEPPIHVTCPAGPLFNAVCQPHQLRDAWHLMNTRSSVFHCPMCQAMLARLAEHDSKINSAAAPNGSTSSPIRQPSEPPSVPTFLKTTLAVPRSVCRAATT